jgi:hypothetical protein
MPRRHCGNGYRLTRGQASGHLSFGNIDWHVTTLSTEIEFLDRLAGSLRAR